MVKIKKKTIKKQTKKNNIIIFFRVISVWIFWDIPMWHYALLAEWLSAGFLIWGSWVQTLLWAHTFVKLDFIGNNLRGFSGSTPTFFISFFIFDNNFNSWFKSNRTPTLGLRTWPLPNFLYIFFYFIIITLGNNNFNSRTTFTRPPFPPHTP